MINPIRNFVASIWLRTSSAVALMLSLCLAARAQEVAPTALLANAKAATVVILSGEGAGRLRSTATGVLVSKDGVILTAFHAVKGAQEVQVRLASGEVFDRVELLGVDERRDVAALKISGSGVAFLAGGSSDALAAGDRLYAVTNANGLTWSATEGILSAVRPADEIPGAGTGFRVLQFTAPVSPGSSGGALMDRTGKVVGIITGAAGNAGVAVPIESVSGLSDLGRRIPLGSGAALQLPQKLDAEVPKSSAAIASANPREILKNAKTIYIHSKTAFLTVDTVDRALTMQKDWDKLGLTIVGEERVADLIVEIDRPLFTYVHTFVISDKKTTIVLGSGKQTAFDGTIASGGLAKDIVKIFATARFPPPPAKK
jgi:Trypsin-like peptidase domain